ncbi:hypothetical protein B7494_g7433 [Chlorociboria aeruginascens]|nr:hypothetical protein B7494_g7433 [Chlorociboria aeruginascens]
MVMENIKLTEEKIKEREDYKKTLMDKIEEDWDEGDDKEDDVKDDIEDKPHRRAPPRSRQSAQNFRSAQMHQNSWIHTQSYRSSRDYGNSYTIVTSMRRPSSKIRGSHVIIDSKYQHQPEDYYSSRSYNKTNVPHRVIPKYLSHDDQSSYYSEPRPAASTKYVPHIIAASQGPDDFYTQPLNTTSESYRRPRCSGGDRGEQRRYR